MCNQVRVQKACLSIDSCSFFFLVCHC
ncbi:hypothetical protein F383_01084 [Gossypium arboreum]|uniref:Uncharacterized protein n=1 Tax=Gossypium arboreum TaxID=29729 RepID=A0A0B0PAA2_GOSAR|nr:hypothetical protein F383_01084 [Gossypium arboreum]